MPAIDRLAIIENGLKSGEEEIRRICVKALGVGLNADHFTRSGGVEARGSGLPEEDWAPKYDHQIAEYWVRCFDMLAGVILQRCPESELAREELGRRLRGILKPLLVEKFEPGFRRVAEALQGFWPEAIESLRSLFEFERAGFLPPQLQRLEQWVEWITPKDLGSRLVVTVTAAAFEHTKTADGRFVDTAGAKAEALADELALRVADLKPHLESLQAGEQRQAFAFGRRLASKVPDSTLLIEVCLASLGRVPPDKRNSSLLGGVLTGVADRAVTNRILDRVAASPELIDQLVPLTRQVPVDASALQRIVDLMASGVISPLEMRHFAYGSVLDGLVSDAVLKLLRPLVHAQPHARAPVFEVICMYVYRSDERWRACRDFLRELMLSPEFSLSLRSTMDLHHWQEAAQTMLTENRDEVLARELTSQIIAAQKIEEFRFSGDWAYRPLLATILSAYAETCWPLLAVEVLSRDHYRMDGLLRGFGFDERQSSVLWKVPTDLLVTWAKENPVGQTRVLAIMTPFYADKEGLDHWHPSVLALLAEGVNEDGKRAVAGNLFSYGSTGSRVPYIERRIRLLHALDDHPQASVREMARELVTWFEADKVRQQASDEQEAAGIY